MRKTYAVIIVLFSFISATLAQPLTGIKTIGGTSPDYATLNAAVMALNVNGVGTGGVIFNIRDGIYTDNVTITSQGSATNPILFQSENQDADLVTINSSAAANVITLTDADYITFSELTIDYSGFSTYSAIKIEDNADNITITDCILDGAATSGTTYASSAIYASESSSGSDCDNFVLQNCRVRNGSYGIAFDMSTSQPAGLSISGNEFENNYAGGIYLKDLNGISIDGNTIHNNESNHSSRYGMNIDNCDGQISITKNYIYTDNGGRFEYGIYLNGSASTQGNESLIANNSVQIENTTSIAYGIYQSNNSNYYIITNNTVYISGGTSATTACYNGYTAANDIILINNIFVNASLGTNTSSNRTVYIGNTSSINQIGYNCYWTTNIGNPFRGYYGNAYTTFNSFTTATGETTSLNIDPQMIFVSGIGWKATNTSLIGSALNLNNVTNDIDGNARVTPTTIGSHELDISISVQDNKKPFVNAYEWQRTLFINSNLKQNADVNLFDINGRLVLNESINLSEISGLDISTIETGIYVVSVSSAGKLFSSKLYIR